MAGTVRQRPVVAPTVAVTLRWPRGAGDSGLEVLDYLQELLGLEGRAAVLERLVLIAAHHPKELRKLNGGTPWPAL